MTEMTETAPKEVKKYTYKPSKKNDLFMELWTDPASPTFGNVYKSGIKAGFSKTYSKNLLNIAPNWLLTYIDKTNFTADHIKNGLQSLATKAPDSRSPDDTRLKAYEILAKITGILDNKQGVTTNILVQPILNGESVKQSKQVIIEQDSEIIPETPQDTG
jgi:hypothetical protein